MMRLAASLTLVLASIGPAGPVRASAPDPPPRRTGEVEKPTPPVEKAPPPRAKADDAGDTEPDADSRGPQPPSGEAQQRRGIEELPPPAPSEVEGREVMGEMTALLDRTCRVGFYPAVLRRLLGLRNQSQLVDLEAWGDAANYRPNQKVFFFFRSPRAAYVTLFWIGPHDDMVIPVQNVRIPGQRNVKLHTGGIVVPPLGRERWVAVNTLEPIPIPCQGTEKQVMATLDRIEKIPHGVGRWEVFSSPDGHPEGGSPEAEP
jgi:hypothetical protein